MSPADPSTGEPGIFETVYLWQGPPRLELQRETRDTTVGGDHRAHRLVVQKGIPGVVIAAGDAQRLLFVRHARPAAGEELLELPRGFGDAEPGDNADPDAAACRDAERELREETGYSALATRIVGRYVTDSSLLPGIVAVAAVVVDPEEIPRLTDGEVAGCVWIDRADVPGLMRRGVFRDAHTLAALALTSLAP